MFIANIFSLRCSIFVMDVLHSLAKHVSNACKEVICFLVNILSGSVFHLIIAVERLLL
jgi:hypothetical protein